MANYILCACCEEILQSYRYWIDEDRWTCGWCEKTFCYNCTSGCCEIGGWQLCEECYDAKYGSL